MKRSKPGSDPAPCEPVKRHPVCGAAFSYAAAGIALATFLGPTFFDERPDAMTILGALVIVGAGLYVWQREARIAAATREQAQGT